MKLKCTCGNFIFNELFILTKEVNCLDLNRLRVYECIKCYSMYKVISYKTDDYGHTIEYKLEELEEE